MWGAGDGVDDKQQDDGGVVVVGYAFMAKKMDSMSKVVHSDAGDDGVEFIPLDFSRHPDEHPHVDIILHKLSDDIMFREVRPEGHERLSWIEAYLAGHPETVIVDPIDKVASVINRVTTLELLTEAYQKHGAAGGMPRPPRFTVVHNIETQPEGASEVIPGSGLAFPVICKPVEACGIRGSHTMVVVLDQSGLSALTVPVVVQECTNHGAKLFKICVVGDDIRVCERPSLPDLPPGLTGSFAFDSQKPYPTLAEVEAGSEAAAAAHEKSLRNRPVYGLLEDDGEDERPSGFPDSLAGTPWDGRSSKVVFEAAVSQSGTGVVVPREPPTVSMESARLAAVRMRETFGLSIFGFDLIVDGATGENMVIDVNYFPSFKDLADFPQVLRRRLKEVATCVRDGTAYEGSW